MHKKIGLLIIVGLLTIGLVVGGWACKAPAAKETITFAIVSDPHIVVAAPGFTLETDPYIDSEPGRKLHRESVELFTAATKMVNAIPDLDFVLIPGDLTKDSERYNHEKLLELLPKFKAPVYVVAGNHDRKHPEGVVEKIDPKADIVDVGELPTLYKKYWGPGGKPYYSVTPVAGVQLIALDSGRPQDHDGEIDAAQLAWLRSELEAAKKKELFVIVMLHHCIAIHTPAFKEGHPMHSLLDYAIIENSEEVKSVLKEFDVPLVLVGHFHAQDIIEEDGIYHIITGSTVSYPHPVRILELNPKTGTLKVATQIIQSIPSRPQLQDYSREALSTWFEETIGGVLQNRLKVPEEPARVSAKHVRGMWAMMYAGDEQFQYKLADIFPSGTSGNPGADAMIKLLLGIFNDASDKLPQDNNVTIYLRKAVEVGK